MECCFITARSLLNFSCADGLVVLLVVVGGMEGGDISVCCWIIKLLYLWLVLAQ